MWEKLIAQSIRLWFPLPHRSNISGILLMMMSSDMGSTMDRQILWWLLFRYALMWGPLRFPHKNDVRFVFTSSYLSYLRYFCLFAHNGVQHISCCVFVLFVFVLCLVYHMLPVSLDCPVLISPSVFSNVYLYTLMYNRRSYNMHFQAAHKQSREYVNKKYQLNM